MMHWFKEGIVLENMTIFHQIYDTYFLTFLVGGEVILPEVVAIHLL